MFELKLTPISRLRVWSRPFMSCGTRAQSSGSGVRIFVRSTGGCGGFLRSWRFWNTAGYGSGGIPSEEETCDGGGAGRSNGGGSGGAGAAVAMPTMAAASPKAI